MPSMCYTASSTAAGLLATASVAHRRFLRESTLLFVVSAPMLLIILSSWFPVVFKASLFNSGSPSLKVCVCVAPVRFPMSQLLLKEFRAVSDSIPNLAGAQKLHRYSLVYFGRPEK